MEAFDNSRGAPILARMVAVIQSNKAFLSEIDGLIGDGDHGMNMNKGFTLFANRFLVGKGAGGSRMAESGKAGSEIAGGGVGADLSFSKCLDQLGQVLLGEIGGSMGPIYGTLFMAMAEAAESSHVGADAGAGTGVGAGPEPDPDARPDLIDLRLFHRMLAAGHTELLDVVDARVGEKTLVDTLAPSVAALEHAIRTNKSFVQALSDMKQAAEEGKESTRELIARFGRSSRLGERSRGVLDAGAVSCCLILQAMADGMIDLLTEE